MMCLNVLSEGCVPERSCERVDRECLGRVDSRMGNVEGGGSWRIGLLGLLWRASCVSSVCMCIVGLLMLGIGGRRFRMDV